MKVAPLLVLASTGGCGIGVGGATTLMRTTDPVAITDPDGTARRVDASADIGYVDVQLIAGLGPFMMGEVVDDWKRRKIPSWGLALARAQVWIAFGGGAGELRVRDVDGSANAGELRRAEQGVGHIGLGASYVLLTGPVPVAPYVATGWGALREGSLIDRYWQLGLRIDPMLLGTPFLMPYVQLGLMWQRGPIDADVQLMNLAIDDATGQLSGRGIFLELGLRTAWVPG